MSARTARRSAVFPRKERGGRLFGFIDRLELGTSIRDVTMLLQKR